MENELGCYIRKIRKEKKYSSKEAAYLTGISKSYWDFIENGLRNPSYEILIKIAKTLNCEIDDLTKLIKDTPFKRIKKYKEYNCIDNAIHKLIKYFNKNEWKITDEKIYENNELVNHNLTLIKNQINCVINIKIKNDNKKGD